MNSKNQSWGGGNNIKSLPIPMYPEKWQRLQPSDWEGGEAYTLKITLSIWLMPHKMGTSVLKILQCLQIINMQFDVM